MNDAKWQAQLNDLKKLAQESTPGPWFVYRPLNPDDAYIAYGTQGDDSDTYDLIDSYDVDNDYEYIAAAHPQVILRLIAELAKAQQLISTFARTQDMEGTREDWMAYTQAHNELVAAGRALLARPGEQHG